jgi:hypothetical protein
MPDFLCKDAYRVGECQGGAIVAKLEATLDAAGVASSSQSETSAR